MSTKPAITATSFNCPHCGVLAQQFWSKVHLTPLADGITPNRWTHEQINQFEEIDDDTMSSDVRRKIANNLRRILEGEVFTKADETSYSDALVSNLHLTRCYNCKKFAVWIADSIVYPPTRQGPAPNTDLPENVRSDYEEARSILALSPRGSAALLRLAIQKLCKHLDESGKNLNEDIGSLVKKGLDPRVQKSLDVVRVIGNNAVHPGQIDLSDDRDIADKLLGLINLIAEIMITQPNHVESMYASLPEEQLKQIDKRDKPTK